VLAAFRDIAWKFRRYMLIRTVVSSLTGLLTWLFALAVGLDLAAAWGGLAFAFNYIPFVGSIAAVIPRAVIQQLRDHGAGHGRFRGERHIGGHLRLAAAFWILGPGLSGPCRQSTPQAHLALRRGSEDLAAETLRSAFREAKEPSSSSWGTRRGTGPGRLRKMAVSALRVELRRTL
jgi:hypothetical protein